MLTFQSLYTEVQAQVMDLDATSLITIKRGVNQGAKKFSANLNIEWRTTYKTFDVKASQQYYQFPEEAIRINNVSVTIGNVTYNLDEIEDSDTWNDLNTRSQKSSIPQFYYVKGADQFGIYPIPSSDQLTAGELGYERRMRDMSVDDYTTGTIAVQNNSNAVVGSGTTFTALMVGRSIHIGDPSGDGQWYKVSAFTDTTHISIENNYSGLTASSQSYVIGELPDIPDEFHESLIDYGCFRYYLRRKDAIMAGNFKSIIIEAMADCKAIYGSKSTSQYYKKPKIKYGYKYMNRDLAITP